MFEIEKCQQNVFHGLYIKNTVQNLTLYEEEKNRYIKTDNVDIYNVKSLLRCSLLIRQNTVNIKEKFNLSKIFDSIAIIIYRLI